jgi:hypothetical protein
MPCVCNQTDEMCWACSTNGEEEEEEKKKKKKKA